MRCRCRETPVPVTVAPAAGLQRLQPSWTQSPLRRRPCGLRSWPAQVVEVLTDALSLPETPVPLKVARLLLASDILHNSTAPVRNASRYRSLLEAALPDVFESLQVCP